MAVIPSIRSIPWALHGLTMLACAAALGPFCAGQAIARELPRPEHVVVVILENRSASQVYGSVEMPYLNHLAAAAARMTDAHAGQTPYGIIPAGYTSVLPARPSQPNYLYLFSGNNQRDTPEYFEAPAGISDYPAGYGARVRNDEHGNLLPEPIALRPGGIGNRNLPDSILPLTTPNLGSALREGGASFASFAESLPYPSFAGAADAGTGGSYRRKHNPVINWINLTARDLTAAERANTLPVEANLAFEATLDPGNGRRYRGFAVDANGLPLDFESLPTVSLVIPNQRHDAHDGSLGEADQWLSQEIGPYAEWAMIHNSLLIITFDEDGGTDRSHGDPGSTGLAAIPTLFYGPMVSAGDYPERIDHLNVLATLIALCGDLESFRREFALAYTGPEARQELLNLRPILDVFAAGPPLTPLLPLTPPLPPLPPLPAQR
jgi:hypothetical protein